jgi:hypothetical protein
MECAEGPSHSCRSLKVKLQDLTSRKIILLATGTIHNETLFVNGLYQNVVILYKLLDAMGYAPILLVNDKPSDIQSVPIVLKKMRMITAEEIIKSSVSIHMQIEIAMSIDPAMRKHLRKSGTKVVKLYLGNILNIDIETPIFYPSVHFAHHIAGELDEIWVSPHYKQHYEYAGYINDCKAAKIAPYVWDPFILTLNKSRTFKWRPCGSAEPQVIVILEPNICFQKCSLIPLLIVDHIYKKTGRDVKVLVGNSERIQANPFFTKTILPLLDIYKDGKIVFSGRNTITSIMNDYPSAIAIGHQWNNQYNYMTLEYLYAGFPIIHNSPDWSDAGYYYEGSDILKGAAALKKAMDFHETSLETYASGATVLQWRHSIYNPEVQRVWKELLEV